MEALTVETLTLVLTEGSTIADVVDRCDVRPSADSEGWAEWVNADGGAVDFRMAVLAADGPTVTVRFAYVPGLYDSPKDWLAGGVFRTVVASVDELP